MNRHNKSGDDIATPVDPVAAGTARDVLGEVDFRRVYVASFLSNTGRWMQAAALGVLGWELTESSAFLGALLFANLIPLALLSLVGGSLADSADRRKLLVGSQCWQLVFTLLLAALVIDDDIAPALLLGVVFISGLGQGLYAPVFTSILPSLAGTGNIAAAVSLNSTQMNLSRIIGPAIGGWLTAQVGFAEVFLINALSYFFVIGAIAVTKLPETQAKGGASRRDRFLGGFIVARRAPQVGWPLATMMAFSFFCLPFIGQLPAIAELNLGIDAQSSDYGTFYAIFGVGALFGALAVGTVLARTPRHLTARAALVAFGLALGWMSVVTSPSVGFISIAVVGFFYFIVPTTLSTAWQEHVDETVRGRVSALWVLSFGGTVPVANLIAGPVVEATSLRTVMMFGMFAAFALAAFSRLRPGAVVNESILD